MMTDPLPPNHSLLPLAQLREQIVSHFNLEGLRTLCFDLKVNYDELPHSGLTPKVQDLIQVMWQRDHIEMLLTAVTQIYPQVPWPDLAALQADTLVDLALTTPHEKPGIWAGVPPMPPNFLGRDELIASLLGRLTSGDSLALSAEGQPGVGKTALAVAIAHHRKILAHFKDGILWAGLGPQADVMSALAAWGLALGQDISHLTEAIERQQAIQRAIGRRQMLLVIDDAWELDAARALRGGGPHCCHLLTTRDKGLARAFAGVAHTEYVPTLADDPAFTLLQTLAPEACLADPDVARHLAQAMDGLPLALELLGGYLAAPERSLFPDLSQAALAEMGDPLHRLQLAQERLGAPGIAVTLQETIALSLEGLCETEVGQRAVEAFYALGVFAPKPERFSREAAEAVTNSNGATLALLLARNLVEMQEGQLALHQVLADVAQTGLATGANVRHRDYYLRLINENREDWRRIATVYGQVQWAWQQVPLADVLDFVWALDIYQQRQGLWHDYLAWANRGLESVRIAQNRRDEGILLNNIGNVYYRLGQWDKALDFYNRALSIREKVSDRPGLAATFSNIGLVYYGLGQRDKALDFLDRALPIREEVGDRPGLAATLGNIGLVYYGLGQRDKALDFYNQALSIREEVGDRFGLASTLNNIGLVYYGLGQRDKALDFYNQALSIREEVGDRPGLAATLTNIGLIYYRLEQWDKALDFYNRALPIREEVGDRPGLAATLGNIGNVYYGLGQRNKALDYFNRALSIRKEVGDRPGLATALNNVGGAYNNLGQWEKALEYLNRALSIRKEVGDRPGLAATLGNIGNVYYGLGQRNKALDYFNRALSIRKEVGDRPGESVTRYALAMIYWDQGRLTEAVAELQHVVELDRLVQHQNLERDKATLAEVEAELAQEK